jgi:hypothetical protein
MAAFEVITEGHRFSGAISLADLLEELRDELSGLRQELISCALPVMLPEPFCWRGGETWNSQAAVAIQGSLILVV